MGHPKVICFDADETLIDFRPAMHEALRLALRRIRILAPSAGSLTVERLIEDRNAVAREMGAAASMEGIRLEAFRRSLRPFDVTDDVVAEVSENYLDDRFRLAQPYSDVIPTLTSLQGRYLLGLATNGNSYPDRAGLDDFFGFTVYAQDCGYRKPDRAFFKTVGKAAARDASEIVYVGDSLQEDIEGAKRAGFRAIWVNRNRAPSASPALADAVITSLTELPQAVADLP